LWLQNLFSLFGSFSFLYKLLYRRLTRWNSTKSVALPMLNVFSATLAIQIKSRLVEITRSCSFFWAVSWKCLIHPYDCLRRPSLQKASEIRIEFCSHCFAASSRFFYKEAQGTREHVEIFPPLFFETKSRLWKACIASGWDLVHARSI